MSIQGSNTEVKGKVIKGSGSILANLDARARRAFARRANKAEQIKKEKHAQKELNQELEEIHQHIVERNENKPKANTKPLSYWLLSASLAEIWQHIFTSSKQKT